MARKEEPHHAWPALQQGLRGSDAAGKRVSVLEGSWNGKLRSVSTTSILGLPRPRELLRSLDAQEELGIADGCQCCLCWRVASLPPREALAVPSFTKAVCNHWIKMHRCSSSAGWGISPCQLCGRYLAAELLLLAALR